MLTSARRCTYSRVQLLYYNLNSSSRQRGEQTEDVKQASVEVHPKRISFVTQLVRSRRICLDLMSSFVCGFVSMAHRNRGRTPLRCDM